MGSLVATELNVVVSLQHKLSLNRVFMKCKNEVDLKLEVSLHHSKMWTFTTYNRHVFGMYLLN